MSHIAAKLSAIAYETPSFVGKARVISRNGFPDPLPALLNAIDETILGRTLEIKAGDSVISLNVAARRLRGISSVSPASTNHPQVVGVTLSPEDADAIEHAHGMLENRLNGAELVTLRAKPSSHFGDSHERGVAATTLAKAWGLSLDTPDLQAGPAIARFLSVMDGDIVGLAQRTAGADIATQGQSEGLSVILDEQLPTLIEKRPTDERRQMFVMQDTSAGGDLTAALIDGDDHAVLRVAPEHLSRILTVWQAL